MTWLSADVEVEKATFFVKQLDDLEWPGWDFDGESVCRVLNNGLGFAVTCGRQRGTVSLSVLVTDSPPKKLEAVEWDVCEEFSMELHGPVIVADNIEGDPTFEGKVIFSAAGWTRFRVYAKGRDSGALSTTDAKEKFYLCVWPEFDKCDPLYCGFDSIVNYQKSGASRL